MYTYDYRINAATLERINQNMESLSNQQLLKLAELAQGIQEEGIAKHKEHSQTFFNTAILPCLKNLAKMAESLLAIDERDDGQTFQATIRHPETITVFESGPCVQTLFLMAESIEIYTDDEGISLTLTYNF